MIKAVTHSAAYFQAPADYFWRWADKSAVIEWNNGTTICYRDDLIALLKAFSGKGLPRLDPVLLVIAACQGNISIDHKLMLLQPINVYKDSMLYGLLDKAVECLQMIAALPEKLRKGRCRLLLIEEVFAEAAPLQLHATQIKDAADELNSGRLDQILEEKKAALEREAYCTDLGYLKTALEKFKNTSTLALKLRTGLYHLPEPVEVALPDRPALSLLEQLEEDVQTRGLATLARKLLAVINIPLHSQGSGGHSYGGISDITNRGNYDRLLLSELAQDDALLMARLVNNEALYFRREEPPDNPKRKRTLLLDVSLKMWGVPRVFSLAAALAFINHSKHGEEIAAYVLGDTFFEVDLSVKEGVIASLEKLHHSLHSGKSLEAAVAAGAGEDLNEYVLFTEIGLLHNAAFQASLQKVLEELRFIIAVDRTGELQFFECNHGKTRLLNTARIDLNELLVEPARRVKPEKNDNGTGLALMNCHPLPLLFPKTRISQKQGKMSLLAADGLLAVTENQRLLLMLSKNKGAHEILLYIERGTYTFGYHNGKAYLLVSNGQKKLLKLYSIETATKEVTSFELPQEIGFTREIVFTGSNASIKSDTGDYTFNCDDYRLQKNASSSEHWHALAVDRLKAQHKPDQQLVNSFLLSTIGFHSTIYSMRELYISNEGMLVMGNYHLAMVGNNSGIRIVENTSAHSPACYSKITNSNYKLLPNKSIKCCLRQWADGSQAVVDARGLLHLKSADASLPEICIVLISGAFTACWAADGISCGVAYFIDEKYSAIIAVEVFYKKYIQPFIDHIVRHDTTATV